MPDVSAPPNTTSARSEGATAESATGSETGNRQQRPSAASRRPASAPTGIPKGDRDAEERYQPYYRLRPLTHATEARHLRAQRQRDAQRLRHAPPREPAWAPPPPLHHSPTVAPPLTCFAPGEARFSTPEAQLADDLRRYGCHQRSDGSFIESYAADLAVWLKLTNVQRLAARLHDWSRPRQSPPSQHSAPRGEVTVRFLDEFGQDSAGNTVHAWTMPAGTRARTRRHAPDAGVTDWVEANEEPDWLYGTFCGHHELFEERRAERELAQEQGGEEGAWWDDTTSSERAGSGDLSASAGPPPGSPPAAPVRRSGASETREDEGEGAPIVPEAPQRCPTCQHALPRCLCVCDNCGVEIGHCDCNERVGVSASYVEKEDAYLRHLSARDRARIAHEMTQASQVAEDHEQHERHLHEEADKAAERAARTEAKRRAREQQANHLPYCFHAAVVWERPRSYWGKPIPAGWVPDHAAAGPWCSSVPRGASHGASHGASREAVTRMGAETAARSTVRGRPMSRPRRTAYRGCVFLYACNDPSWQARAFRRRFPWGIPRDRVQGPGGWQEWVSAEEAREAQWQAHLDVWTLRRAQAAYETPRKVMEVAREQRLQAAFAELLQTLRPPHHHPAGAPAHPHMLRVAARHKTRLDATEYPLYQAALPAVVARLSQTPPPSPTSPTSAPTWTSLWTPPEELLPQETGLWLSTLQVAELWGIHRDSVCAWHRDHPEILTDKNGVRELHFHLEDVVQRANEKAHATDRFFPWRQTTSSAAR